MTRGLAPAAKWSVWDGLRLGDRSEFGRFRLLGLMRVFGSRIQLELIEHPLAEGALGHHALHGLLQNSFRLFFPEVNRGNFPQAARPLGVPAVRLFGHLGGEALVLRVGHLAATELGLPGVHDDYEVARINAGGIFRLVLAHQNRCNLGRQNDTIVRRKKAFVSVWFPFPQ